MLLLLTDIPGPISPRVLSKLTDKRCCYSPAKSLPGPPPTGCVDDGGPDSDGEENKGYAAFAKLPRAVAQDSRLSYRAQGLLGELWCDQPGWTFTIEHLARTRGAGVEGHSAITGAVRHWLIGPESSGESMPVLRFRIDDGVKASGYRECRFRWNPKVTSPPPDGIRSPAPALSPAPAEIWHVPKTTVTTAELCPAVRSHPHGKEC